MTNICILNDNFSMGGVQKVTLDVGELLSEINDIDVYYYSMSSNTPAYSINSQRYFYHKKNIFERHTFLRKCKNLVRKADKFLHNGVFDPNIYQVNQIQQLSQFIEKYRINILILSSGWLTALISSIKKYNDVKIIAWQHNEADIYINKYFKSFKPAYTNGLTLADRVVCLTMQDKLEYEKYSDKVVCIYNPLSYVPEKKSTLSNKQIAFTARYAIEQKGIDFLIEIAKGLPEGWVVSFAGGGSVQDNTKVKKLIVAENVTNKILLKGTLFDEELYNHYFNSSILISTSRWEGFGLSLIEGMSFGLPVLSFANKGPKEILDFGRYGILIEKDNTNSFVENLRELIETPGRLEEYQRKSIERMKIFEPKIIVRDWIKLIESLT